MISIIDGKRISYEVFGDGVPIICLHGWNENRGVFRTSSYRKFLASHRVYALDLPGFGQSDPIDPLDFTALTYIIDRFANEMGLCQFNLLGQCMGGIIALDYAIRRQDRVRSLFLIETMIYFPLWLNLLMFPKVGSWILLLIQNPSVGRLIGFHKAFRQSKTQRLSGMTYKIRQNYALAYIRLMKDYSKYDHVQRARKVAIPVTIVTSEVTFDEVTRTASDLMKVMPYARIIHTCARSHFIFEA